MQYLLTQEEYNKLQNEAARGRELPDDKELQELCTEIANTMPVLLSWRPAEEPKPWGCIITAESVHYCDYCPAKTICPNKEKHYSK